MPPVKMWRRSGALPSRGRPARRVPIYEHQIGVVAHALVDAEDYARVVKMGKWYRTNDNYIQHQNHRLHRFVLKLTPDDPEVDHIYGDLLDNRKSSLRVCTHAENQQNLHTTRGKSSYRGVSWNTQSQKWRANAKLNGKRIFLGSYDDEHEAARVASAWRAEHMPFSADARNILDQPPEVAHLVVARHPKRVRLRRAVRVPRTQPDTQNTVNVT